MVKAGVAVTTALSRRPIFYGWWIVITSALGMTTISAVTWQATGTFLVALEREFHWSRALLSGAFSVARTEGAFMGPVEGALADRVGVRKILLCGFLLCAAGFFFFSQVSNPITFYVAFFIITTGAGLGGYIPIATTINHWFVRRRTTAMAFIMVGGSIGGTLLPLLAWGIVAHGWRWVAAGTGVFLLLVALPVVGVIRNRPESMGLEPDGDPSSGQDPLLSSMPRSRPEGAIGAPAGSGYTARQAIKTWAFWGIALSHAGSAILVSTLGLHLVPHLTDHGMSLPLAGTVVLVFTATSALFQLVGGWLGDRFDKRLVIFSFMTLQGATVLFLLVVETLPMAILYAVLAGVGHGGRAPPATTIRGDYFGRRAFGTILGISMIPMNIGGILIPLLAGMLFDLRGSYTIPFLTLAGIAFAGAFLILTVRPPARATAG